MDNANYIPLGVKVEDAPPQRSWSPKVIGKTPEERREIARSIRLDQRKEKKKLKSEARAQRKINGALHRKLNRNTEKYNKNKDRNKQRAIDLERQKIRNGAVKQAERLAAIYDPSGKMFNVGEIIILESGKVTSKEGMRRAVEAREQKEKEEAERKAVETRYKNAERAAKLEAEEAQRAAVEGRPVPEDFPAKDALKRMKRPKRISKKKLQRQELLRPQPLPPKPVIPEGFSLPEGEEDLLALWDITDEKITKRLIEQKKQKVASRKDLKKIQKENKKLNKALKMMKRQADNAGIIFDKVKARAEILAAQRQTACESASESDSASDSASDSGSDSESDSQSDGGVQVEDENSEDKEPKQAQPPKLDPILIEKADEIDSADKEKKQAAREQRKRERKQAKKAENHAAEETRRLAEEAAQAEETSKAKRAAKKAAKANGEESSSKKRKRSKDEDEEKEIVEDNGKKDKSHKKQKSKSESTVREVEVEVDKKKSKKRKAKENEKAQQGTKKTKTKESKDDNLDRVITEPAAQRAAEVSYDESPSHGAEQWNPDALTGDAARKNKFLRLLGAGKGGSKEKEKDKKIVKKPGVDIEKIQAELERQFEAGASRKHDGGGKKRGLGA